MLLERAAVHLGHGSIDPNIPELAIDIGDADRSVADDRIEETVRLRERSLRVESAHGLRNVTGDRERELDLSRCEAARGSVEDRQQAEEAIAEAQRNEPDGS